MVEISFWLLLCSSDTSLIYIERNNNATLSPSIKLKLKIFNICYFIVFFFPQYVWNTHKIVYSGGCCSFFTSSIYIHQSLIIAIDSTYFCSSLAFVIIQAL